MASQSGEDTVAGAVPPTTTTAEAHPEKSADITQEATIPPVTSDMSAQPASLPTTSLQEPPITSPPTLTSSPQLNRTQTEALGPATDLPIAHPTTSTSSSSGPILNISLMLTTGARHPYKIDEKYLRNRNVTARTVAGDFDPRELSGYQLKELIWTDWRAEWEPRPASPSSIRLILMGRMIEDKGVLKDFPFKMDTTNVVHMTVKPADLIDDDDGATKGTGKGGVLRARDSDDRGAGCRCVVQ